MNLLIVESSEKAKLIQSMLGPTWAVEACLGHVRDLPDRELGVDLETLKPTYQVSDRSARTVNKLKAQAAKSDQIFLATDKDREGEAIAWHLAVLLGVEQPRRVMYTEVTESAVRAAIDSPRAIDMPKVRAQETRRVLDRLVGYLLSPVVSDVASDQGFRRAGSSLPLCALLRSESVRSPSSHQPHIFRFVLISRLPVRTGQRLPGLPTGSRPFISLRVSRCAWIKRSPKGLRRTNTLRSSAVTPSAPPDTRLLPLLPQFSSRWPATNLGSTRRKRCSSRSACTITG